MKKKEMTKKDELRFIKAYEDFCSRHRNATRMEPVLSGDDSRINAIYEVPNYLDGRELHEYMKTMESIGHSDITVDKTGKPIRFVFGSLLDESLGWIILLRKRIFNSL